MLFSNNERKMQNITQLAENFQISQEIPSKIQNPDILRKKEFGGNFFAFWLVLQSLSAVSTDLNWVPLCYKQGSKIQLGAKKFSRH